MTSKERHTIAIIDDHPLFRRGVRELLDLEQGLDVVGEAGTREEAIKLVRRTEPDLTILDLNMKGCSGVEILSTLKDEDPSRRIVVFTVSDSGKDLTACIQAGADGYFLKDMEPEEFLKSIRRALEGQTVVDASMLAFLTTTLRAKMSSTLEERPTLTGREAEVLDLIAKGCTNKVIARRLDITEGTVKGHVKHLLKKLGCRSRVEAAVWAAQQKTAE